MSQPSAVASASFARSSPRCQLWTSPPRLPSGFSRLCSGPATKPSSEIDMWQVVSGMASSRWLRFGSVGQHHRQKDDIKALVVQRDSRRREQLDEIIRLSEEPPGGYR